MGTTFHTKTDTHSPSHDLSGAGAREAEETARAILRAMNSRSIRREQPNSLERLFLQILTAVSREVPVPFLLYWGKGDREAVGEAEHRALAFLERLAGRVQEVYPAGSRFMVLYTDTHARLNGYPTAGIRDYQKSVERLVRTHGMELVPMSRFVGLDLESLTLEAPDVTVEPALVDMCRKHFKRSKDYQFGAQIYRLQSFREKWVVQTTFQHHIFLTYSGSSLDALLPTALPVFYMYSLKRGITAKPWFLDASHEGAING